MIEIPGKDHIVTFDGRVIEAFGSTGESTRIHIWMVSDVDFSHSRILGECLRIKYGVGGQHELSLAFDEHYRAQFEQLAQRIQAGRGQATAG